MYLYKNILLFVIICISFYACGDPILPTITNGKPELAKVNSNVFYFGDTLEISGTNFGFNNSQGYILFGNGTKVLAKNCMTWTNNTIKVEMNQLFFDGKLAVIINSDTSNTLDISLTPYPRFDSVLVDAGTFIMGNNKGLDNESPEHNVTISKSFYISKFETTERLWSLVMNDTSKYDFNSRKPKSNVSWLDAVKFCNSISKMKGLDTCYIFQADSVIWDQTKFGWRLPSEAEWEFACRAGTKTELSGNNIADDMVWYNGNSGFNKHTVGTKKANDLNIYDMHGNVWEWCWDWFSEDSYSSSISLNPKGPNSGLRRVLRGGAYSSGTSRIRSSNRTIDDGIDKIYSTVGFRIVRNGN